MRRSWPNPRWLQWLLSGLLLSASAHGQTLQLDVVPVAPELNDGSVILHRAQALRSELDILQGHSTSNAIVASIARAMTATRRIAFALLTEALTDPDENHVAISGLFLAAELDRIDNTLAVLGNDQPNTINGTPIDARQLTLLLALLDRFAARAPQLIDQIDALDSEQLDAALALALEPLLEVLVTIEESAIGDPWPEQDTSTETPLQRLDGVIALLEFEPLRTAAAARLDHLLSRTRFLEYRIQDNRDAEQLLSALGLAPIVSGAAWLTPTAREGVIGRLIRTVENWPKDPNDAVNANHTRAALAHLIALGELIDAVNRLDRVDPRSRAKRRSIDRVITEDFENSRTNQLGARSRRLRRVAQAIDVAITVRHLTKEPPPRGLLVARRALDDAYALAEGEVLERFDELIGTADALVDPGLNGILARQQALGETLQRLRLANDWIAIVAKTDPRAVRRFTRRLDTLGTQLAQPARRDDALAQLDQLERAFAQAAEHPAAAKLRAGDAVLARLSGGQSEALLQAYDAAQSAFLAQLITDTTESEAVAQLDLFSSLLEQLATLQTLDTTDGLALLPRWGGWALHPRAGLTDPSALRARLKMAIHAAVNSNPRDAQAQLARINEELPITTLAVALGGVLGPHLDSLPTTDSQRLARLAIAPEPNDVFVPWRADLLALARWSWELVYAMREGETSLTADIRAHCTALADALLTDLIHSESDL